MLTTELAENPFFDGFTPGQQQCLAGLFTTASFKAGQQVFGQGDPANRVYMLETGEVELRLYPDDGGCLTIALVYPQGIFGWSAVLRRPRYTSFAVCTKAARALTARGSDLRGLVENYPALGRLLLGRMALAADRRTDEIQAELARLIQDEMTYATL